MSKKKQETPTPGEEDVELTPGEETGCTAGTDAPAEAEAAPEEEALSRQLAAKEEQYLRLAAEYDNFRKRSQKEKEAVWSEAKASTVSALLPVYDNLERAVKQSCSDEAYAKGVEMTLTQLKEILGKLGVEEIPALGQPFDPNAHNAVMHVEDDTVEENTVVEVFQAGFRCGEKVIRFAMVKVAN